MGYNGVLSEREMGCGVCERDFERKIETKEQQQQQQQQRQQQQQQATTRKATRATGTSQIAEEERKDRKERESYLYTLSYPPLPPMLWSPPIHHLFPPSFQRSVYIYLCCHYREEEAEEEGVGGDYREEDIMDEKEEENKQRKKQKKEMDITKKKKNHLANLPTSIVLNIITFMSQEWFEQRVRERDEIERQKSKKEEEETISPRTKLLSFFEFRLIFQRKLVKGQLETKTKKERKKDK